MKEIKAIISAYDNIDKAKTSAALATVVRVEGSSYRRTGARMLVTDDGVWVGGISGGCLEGDALKRARLAIAKSESSLITYDTTEDDAYQIGVGLGCNGIIDVLFTPLQYQDKNNPVEVLKTCVAANRQTNVLVTITNLEGFWPDLRSGNVIRYKTVQSLAVFADAAIEQQLEEHVNAQIDSGKSRHVDIGKAGGEKLTVFIEILLPEIRLVLMGHQYDIYPLARLTKEVGWQVTMVSNPLKINTKIADTVDAIFSYDQLSDIRIDRYTAIVLMSHDYKTDKANLPKVLQTEAFYIGMLGPRVRSEKIFNELAKEGQSISGEYMERIYAPAGLDIGALSPEEIALSIIAEIKTVFSKRGGTFLKFRHSPIHERS
ncbi:XdhC family protein [uncultured Mucilaginibacter sp.]|uniref:XdhC family protein n=1 Tax=uncultured Mucilaginibacter sp. TaxID=797541 RepID=UPI0025FEFED4|nr:XdhC family protein [uncultured Mucilaginibacter sp.]